MEEEVSELVLLEVGQEVAAGLDGAELGHVVRKTAVHPSGCNEEKHVSMSTEDRKSEMRDKEIMFQSVYRSSAEIHCFLFDRNVHDHLGDGEALSWLSGYDFHLQLPDHYVSYAIDLDGRGQRVETGMRGMDDGHGQQRNLNYFFAALIKPFADLSRWTHPASAEQPCFGAFTLHLLLLQGDLTGCRTGNGGKLSNS